MTCKPIAKSSRIRNSVWIYVDKEVRRFFAHDAQPILANSTWVYIYGRTRALLGHRVGTCVSGEIVRSLRPARHTPSWGRFP